MSRDEEIKAYLALDEASISGLVWRLKPSRPISAGSPALTGLRSDGYRGGKFKGRYLYSHRVVFFLANGYWAKEVDHIDGVRDNNTASNLRDTVHHENMQNIKGQGFSFDTSCGKFRARLYLSGKEIVLGYFDNIIDARAAYLKGKREYHPFATERCLGGAYAS